MKKLKILTLCITFALCLTMISGMAINAATEPLTDYSKNVLIFSGSLGGKTLTYASLTDGASVYVNDTTNFRQSWSTEDEGGGYISIRPLTCLDMALTVANDSPNNTAPIQLSYYTGARSQLFKLEDVGSYLYKITTQSSSNAKCIEVRDNVPANGSIIQQYTYSGATKQKWDVVNYGYELCHHSFIKGVCKNCQAQLGDVNEDGMINDVDVITLKRYLMNWENQAISSELSDADQNGSINAKDEIFIARLVSGWDMWG